MHIRTAIWKNIGNELTIKFFQRKMSEYDNLKRELKALEAEIEKNKKDKGDS